MRRLFRQFSFPGGIPSHVAPETPGSIHEGGELGYSLSHAYGAAFDNPDLVVACVIGDGEAETGPLAAQLALQQVPRPGRATARCCRSCTSTATRSPTRRCWPGSATTSWTALLRGLRLPAVPRRGRRPGDGAPALAAHAGHGLRRDRRDPAARPATDGRRDRPALADDRAAHARRAGPARRRSTACRSRAPGGPTRCRWPAPATTPTHLALLEDVDALLPARGAVRRRRAPRAPSC